MLVPPPEIIRSLDEAVRSNLEGGRDWYFGWLQWSTIIVAFGCLLEVPEVIHELWEEKIPKLWVYPIKVISSIGLGLVIAGIAGEWFFEARVTTAEGLVQELDETLLSDTQRETALAQLQTAILRRDTQALKTEADTQRAIADSALKQAGEANKIAAKEKLDEAQLELLVSPRRLTIDQQERIGKSCPGLNRAKVFVSSYGMDAEGGALAHQIAWAIFDHSFDSEYDGGGIITSGGFDEGVLLSGPPESVPFLNCIADALRSIGNLDEIKVNGERHSGTTMAGSAVMVGSAIMSGGGGITPPTVPPPGSPIKIFVGVKPIKLLELKQ